MHSEAGVPQDPPNLASGFPLLKCEWVLVVSRPWGPGADPRTADRWCLLQMHSIRNLPSTQLREQQQEDGVEDMTQLE